MDAILAAELERIVYVSCNSATLANDAEYLCEFEYDINFAQQFDMFTQAAHVECVVLMSRREG